MKFPEKYRITHPLLPHCFDIPFEGRIFYVIASYDLDWEHVSVTLQGNRCPNWREMCYMKDLFWEDNEECIQVHPKKSEYVDLHPYCLHIWKPPKDIQVMLEDRLEENKDKDK